MTEYRDWQCSCSHSFTAEVVLSEETNSLSGEAVVWCPKCNKRPLQGSQAYVKLSLKHYEALEKDPLDRSTIERLISGELRATIIAHGPINREQIGSASKRITGGVIAIFKTQARDAVVKSAQTLAMREEDGEYERLREKNTRQRKIIHDLLQKCQDAGLIPVKENHDDRDKEV